MRWDERFLTDEEVSRHQQVQAPLTLLDRVNGLAKQQQATWPLLAKGIQGLTQVKIKRFTVGRFTILAQHNPQRIISTTAKVDQESIERRACFLCAENLPPEEKAVAFDEDFIILCNPYPIVERHLSIVHREHRPQIIAGHFETLLGLAEKLSAPDHLHFQAGTRAVLPIEEHFRIGQSQSVTDHRLSHSAGDILRAPEYHLPVLLICGSNKQTLNDCFNEMVGRLARLTKQEEEPMLNLIAFADQATSNQSSGSTLWTVVVFPRSKHRPDCFFADGEQKLTVSPAALDLAGLVVVPVREHFDRITSSDVRQILTEVTLNDDVFARLVTG
jgi:hypothetical protein